jgi:hypothetical protein
MHTLLSAGWSSPARVQTVDRQYPSLCSFRSNQFDGQLVLHVIPTRACCYTCIRIALHKSNTSPTCTPHQMLTNACTHRVKHEQGLIETASRTSPLNVCTENLGQHSRHHQCSFLCPKSSPNNPPPQNKTKTKTKYVARKQGHAIEPLHT